MKVEEAFLLPMNHPNNGNAFLRGFVTVGFTQDSATTNYQFLRYKASTQ
ncbi:Hypothetical protein I595_1829 [Croceitalea dokdonensis DOKDO 023]|uniref:Uncharacterized protein n=1 Tax=Croceitalea dokdonensis DOKDO 023 TaxID=1300341 RepID=A0A0N8H424_9FLAO|nr:Hypothetical protein I595_1829 [Croceitalea dokdonensis DOKDO 023]